MKKRKSCFVVYGKERQREVIILSDQGNEFVLFQTQVGCTQSWREQRKKASSWELKTYMQRKRGFRFDWKRKTVIERRKPEGEVLLGAVKLNSWGLYKAFQINKERETSHTLYRERNQDWKLIRRTLTLQKEKEELGVKIGIGAKICNLLWLFFTLISWILFQF